MNDLKERIKERESLALLEVAEEALEAMEFMYNLAGVDPNSAPVVPRLRSAIQRAAKVLREG